MIKEAYCSFEVAKLLKEKGFNERSAASYDSKGQLQEGYGYWNKTPIWYAAPTHQMAMAWLRKEKRIFIRIIEDGAGEVFRYEIYNHTPDNNGDYYISNTYIDSYEEAVKAALKYSLEKLI